NGARKRQQLSLAYTDRRATLSEDLRITVRQPRNDAIGAHALSRKRDVALRDRVRQPNVRQHVTGEEKNVLLYVSDERAQLRNRDFPDVDAIDEDATALRIIKAK